MPILTETIGVIDFTTVGKNYQEQALSLTSTMARTITADFQQRFDVLAPLSAAALRKSLRPLSGGKPDSVGTNEAGLVSHRAHQRARPCP